MPYMWMKPSETPYPSWLTSGPRQDQLNSTTEPNPKCWSIESWVNKNAYCLRPPKKFWKDYFGGNNQFVKLTQLNHNYLWPSTSQKQVNFFQPKPYSHRFLPHPVFINILYDSAGSFPGLSTSASVPDFHVLNGFLPGPLTCKLTDQSEVHPPSVCLLLHGGGLVLRSPEKWSGIVRKQGKQETWPSHQGNQFPKTPDSTIIMITPAGSGAASLFQARPQGVKHDSHRDPTETC